MHAKVARFDFSWLDADYHQETLDNLRKAVKNVRKLCAVMLDTVGPELQVCNNNGTPIQLKVDDHVIITPDLSKVPSAGFLPINYAELAKAVKKGDTIFIGQYLFTGNETTSVWLEVSETDGQDVICVVKNSATLAGFLFTIHVAQVHINLPTLSDMDKKVISTWGRQNNVDIVSLSYTRHAADVLELRAFLDAENLFETQIYAKIENVEGLRHFDEILQEADGIILSRGNLGIDLPPEKAESVYNHSVHFKRVVKHVGEPMSHEESVASSAVRAAIKVKAGVIVVLTTSGRAAKLVAKYRPPMPILAVVVPRLRVNSMKWSFSGTLQARQCLAVRGVYPILSSPNADSSGNPVEGSGLTLALNHAKSVGLVKLHDRAVIFQKIGDASVVEIIEIHDH